LRLVPVTPANAELLWRVLQHPDLRVYQDLPNVGAQAFNATVARRSTRLQNGVPGRFEWLIYLSGSRTPAGWVSLRIGERDRRSAEVGYTLLREFRARGIATAAVRALLDEAFERIGLARVRAYCVAENEPSLRLLERIGFARESVLPHGAMVNGRAVDVIVHVMESARWRQSGKTMEMPASAYPA